MQAKGATELLAPSACEAALAGVPATLTKLKAARASCDKLVSKLCADLPPGAQACALVKEKTPSFPAQRCDEMLQHYDEVIGQLKKMEEQGGSMGGGPRGPAWSWRSRHVRASRHASALKSALPLHGMTARQRPCAMFDE